MNDEKVLISIAGENFDDQSNLKFTTHAKDNMKGIIAHTTVFRLQYTIRLSFERTCDSIIYFEATLEKWSS